MKLPAAAYSAEVVTSATKAGSYGVFSEGEYSPVERLGFEAWRRCPDSGQFRERPSAVSRAGDCRLLQQSYFPS